MKFEGQMTLRRSFGRVDLNLVKIYRLRAATAGQKRKRKEGRD